MLGLDDKMPRFKKEGKEERDCPYEPWQGRESNQVSSCEPVLAYFSIGISPVLWLTVFQLHSQCPC